MSFSTIEPYSFEWNDPKLIDCFVENGMVIAKSIFDPEIIKKASDVCLIEYHKNKDKYWEKLPPKFQTSLTIGNLILEEKNSSVYLYLKELPKEKLFLDTLECLLGKNISMLNGFALLFNDPDDYSNFTIRDLHQEMWSGSGVNTILTWIPATKIVPENALTVIPKSHLYGFIPNRNRKILPTEGIELDQPIALTGFELGDVIFFHSLLLHGTAGNSNFVRLALSYEFKETFEKTTYKEQERGHTSLRNGPLTRIRKTLANDLYSQFRVYGGEASNKPPTKKELDQY